jgi:hypothetical protein
MSLMNIGVSPNRTRAIMCADTRAASHEGPTEASKLWVLPHLHAVVGGVGLWLKVHMIANTAMMLQSVDALFDTMPAVMQQVDGQIEVMLPRGGRAPLSIEQQRTTVCAVIAWHNGQIRARVWNGFDDPAFAAHDIGNSYLNPAVSLADIGGRDPLSDAEMEVAARLQVSTYRGTREGIELGGRLLAAEVSERGITVRTVADLEAAS